MMEEEFVRRRQWLTRDEFLDLVGLAGLVPGPSSTEVAILVGYRRAGWRGLLLAGTCFILPAAVIVTALAWAYVHFGRLPAAGGVLLGIKPVIVAVVAQSLVAFGRTAIKTKGLLAIALLAAGADLFDAPPTAILVAAGVLSSLGRVAWRPDALKTLLGPAALAAPATLASPPGLAKLFFIFLKIGSVVFGSGYVLLAFLRADLVEHPHWLDESQLIDAVAVGQFTPGPVFTTATFIGYLLAGLPGAAVATAGVFLPSFVLVALSGPFVPRIRRSPAASAFLDGVVVASLALMAVVAGRLVRVAVVDVTTVSEAVVSVLVLFRWRVNSAWLVLAGGVTGAIVHAVR
jgi:chromate transporter